MADELTVTLTFSYTNGSKSIARSISGSYDVAGDYYDAKLQNVGTGDETITDADIGTLGYCLIKNLDVTNYVEAGVDGTNYSVRINPGEIALFRANGAALHLKANTAACDCEITMIEA